MARGTYYLFEADGYQDVVVRVPAGFGLDDIIEEAVNARCFGFCFGVLHEYESHVDRAHFEGLTIHQISRAEAEHYGVRGAGMDFVDYLTAMANNACASYTPYYSQLAHDMTVYCSDGDPTRPL